MTENKRFVMYGTTLYEIRNNNKVEIMPTDCFCLLSELADENEQLKKELEKFKEWEKHLRGVRREDLDRVFKMSIYEIAEAFDYYRKRIKKLEKELQK